MKKFKELHIEAKDFRVGDLVLSEGEYHTYIIYKIGQSCLHKHPYVKVYYADNYSQKHYIHELVGKRFVIRRK